MLALSVIGCILAAILVMLLIPIHARFFYDCAVMKAHVRYLFIKYRFFPEKTGKKAVKKAEKKTEKEYDKQKQEEEAEPGGLKATLDTVKTLYTLLKSSTWALDYIRRRMVIYGVRVLVTVGGPDAHQTAVSYGRLSSAVYLGIEVLGRVFTIKTPDIRMAPDFLTESTKCEIAFGLRIQPMALVIAGANAF
ncbi:MAG: DUF2953 domain-containing protein, partial [Oscillospiraceae bacterium]|nr:DUF2953 domain-containing protein [Oscillospiraceae bacterium]